MPTTDSNEEIRKALFKMIADVSSETENYIESKGRLIRLPMEARIEPVMQLIGSEESPIRSDQRLDEEELRQKLRFEALVPLVSGIVIKRKREQNGLTIADESVRYGLAIDVILDLFTSHIQAIGNEIIGDKLGEDDGWDHFFSDEARCCPGDDFAYFGNRIKEEQRQRLAHYLGKDK